jgi:DNA-binding GntR family transcriptional regulator
VHQPPPRGAPRVRLRVAGATPAAPTARIGGSIATAIVERPLAPGTKLVEQRIADTFSVPRTIVRQAPNQRSRDRLVAPARGAFVATPASMRPAKCSRCAAC